MFSTALDARWATTEAMDGGVEDMGGAAIPLVA